MLCCSCGHNVIVHELPAEQMQRQRRNGPPRTLASATPRRRPAVGSRRVAVAPWRHELRGPDTTRVATASSVMQMTPSLCLAFAQSVADALPGWRASANCGHAAAVGVGEVAVAGWPVQQWGSCSGSLRRHWAAQQAATPRLVAWRERVWRRERPRQKSPATPSAARHLRRPLRQPGDAVAKKWQQCTQKRCNCFLARYGGAPGATVDRGLLQISSAMHAQ